MITHFIKQQKRRGVKASRALRRKISELQNGGLLAVQISNHTVGFFAHLNWCLQIGLHCERSNIRPACRLASPQYIDGIKGDDFFAYFFQRMEVGHRPLRYLKVQQLSELGFPRDYDYELDLTAAAALVQRLMKPLPFVEEAVHACMSQVGHAPYIAVHYRGTDKVNEAEAITFERVAIEVETVLDSMPGIRTLFVASDSQAFIDYSVTRFENLTVFAHEDSARSKNEQPVHLGTSDSGFDKGLDAIVNCLLLSRACHLVKTPSILSGWAKLFNPSLPMTLVGKPRPEYLWFPERALHEQAESVGKSSLVQVTC